MIDDYVDFVSVVVLVVVFVVDVAAAVFDFVVSAAVAVFIFRLVIVLVLFVVANVPSDFEIEYGDFDVAWIFCKILADYFIDFVFLTFHFYTNKAKPEFGFWNFQIF